MSEYIYTIQPTRVEMLSGGPTPEEERIVGAHYRYLEALADQGVVILAGRTLNTDASSFGVVIFRADSEEAAQEILANDPAVKGGVMRAELFPYRVALIGDVERLEFSFEGEDESDPVCGRGWAQVNSQSMTGRLYFHYGDESGFIALKE